MKRALRNIWLIGSLALVFVLAPITNTVLHVTPTHSQSSQITSILPPVTS